MKPSLRLLPVLAWASLLPLVAGLSACSKPQATAEPVRAVRTTTVAADRVGGTLEFAGEVRARTESRLGFRVGGKMLSRPADVGQRVRTGQVLARLDPTDLRLGLQAADAATRAAESALALAQAEFKRYEELRSQGFISAMELQRRETTLRAQQAQVDQARAQAGLQGNQAGYSTLTAPADGVVTAVEAEVGAVLASGTPVLRLAHDGPRDAVFAVPEDGLSALRNLVGKPGALRVRVWGSDTPLPATVREVAAAADPATRTYTIRADLGSAATQLGQTVSVQLDLPVREGVTRLPLTAVLERQGRSAVWLLDRQAMTVQLQPVVVGGADGNALVIAGGLQPGQTVVTAGVHALTDGQRVRLYEGPLGAPATPPAPPPAPASVAASAGR